MEITRVLLNNGMKMPILGLGTVHIKELSTISYEAVKIGYRHFDTAEMYKNEEQLGEGLNKAISKGLVNREELFVTTKLWPTSRGDPEKALKDSLNRLKMDYVDLYLVHWPLPAFDEEKKEFVLSDPIHKIWAVMESLVEKGLAKAIGVSNFNVQSLLDLLCYCNIRPVLNEIELNPYFGNDQIAELCAKFDIKILCYNSLATAHYNKGRFKIFEEKVIQEVAKQMEMKESQVVLNWALTKEHLIISRTNSIERLEENYKTLKFKLNDSQMDSIIILHRQDSN